jgi:fibronectin-binding autotransporter adhesin
VILLNTCLLIIATMKNSLCVRILIFTTAVAACLCSTFTASATTVLWVGNPGVSATTNWSDALNWSGGAPLQNDAKFGGTGSAGDINTVTSFVDANQAPLSLQYSNASQAATLQFHHTYIPSGVTLNVGNGALTIGGLTLDGYKTQVKMSGPGTLLVTNGLSIGNNGSTGLDNTTFLDLSGLSNFVYRAAAGTINMGSGNRSVADFILAGGSNFINAATFNDNTSSSSSSGTGNLTLGGGTNIIYVNAFNIAGNRGSSTASISGTGGLRVRGLGGTDADRAAMTIGNRNNGGGSGNTCNGTLSLNGHPVDMKLGTVTLGFSGSNPTGSAPGNGTINFDTGVIDATNILMGVSGGTTAGVQANGTINVGATASLVVGAGGISMVNVSGIGTGSGTLNINGGIAQAAGNIRKTTASGTANLTVNSGTLSLTGSATSIGTVPAPLDNVSLSDSTLNIPVTSGSPTLVCAAFTPSGTSNLINLTSMPGVGSFPTQFPVISYTSLGGSYNFVLGTLPGTYQGYLSNNSSSVDIVITNSLAKADVWNGNVNTNWDTTTLNWLYSGSPASFNQGDIATFDNTSTGTTNVYLTTTLLPSSVTSDNSSKPYLFYGPGKLSGNMLLTKQGTSSLTLTETGGDDFTGGIVVNNGTLILDNTNSAITGGLTVNGGTVQVGNNDGNGSLPGGTITVDGALLFARTNNVLVGTPILGTGSLSQQGSGTLTLTSANGYTGGTTIQNGTLALSGAGTISNSTPVVVSSGTFDVSALTQPAQVTSLGLTNSATTVSVAASPFANVAASSVALGGATNRINIASLPPIAAYPVTFVIIQSAAPLDGTFNLGLGNLPTASPPYAANVHESVDQLSVLLTVTSGPIGVRSAVSWIGADVPNLNTNWSDGLNWQLPGAPVGPETVIFNNTAALGSSALSSPGGGSAALIPDNVNNVVDNDFTIASLLYTNSNDSYHNTAINTGKKLVITNTLTIGALDSGSSATHGFVTVSGVNSRLAVSNSAANVQVFIGGASGSQDTLDLSALDTFNAGVSRFLVGASVNNAVNRPSGIIYLAKTNSITAGFQTTTITNGTTTANAGLVVADCNGNAGSRSFLYLGQVNTITADSIGIGRQKASATLTFNSIYANTAPYPTLTLQGFSSSRVPILEIGDSAGNTGTTTLSADADLRGGIINASVDTLTLGRASSGGTSGTTTGTLEFDAGAINVNTLTIGMLPAAITKVGVGTLGVGSNSVIGAGATLTVNTVVNLGQTPFGTASTTTSGTLNLTNGTVRANSIVPGTNSTSTVGLYGGRLFVTNAIGNSITPLTTLNLLPSSPDNARNDLYLAAGSTPSITVTSLNLDEQDTTTNVLNVASIGPVGTPPVELALIKYGTLSAQIGSTFNIGLGTLPAGYSGYLTNDTDQLLIGLVLTSAINPRPVMTGVSLSGTNLVISGTNGFANYSYHVLSSTNVSLPLSTWSSIASGVFGPTGNFTFATPVNPALPQRFYSVVVP